MHLSKGSSKVLLMALGIENRWEAAVFRAVLARTQDAEGQMLTSEIDCHSALHSFTHKGEWNSVNYPAWCGKFASHGF